MSFQDISVSRTSPQAVGVDVHGVATVFHPPSTESLISFPCIWDLGGRRICLVPDLAMCVSGAYGRGGVAAYSTSNGSVLWRRPDVTRVQHISYWARRQSIIIVREGKPALLLEASSGITMAELGTCCRIVASEFADVLLRARTARRLECELIDGLSLESLIPIAARGFAVLDVQFQMDCMLLSEAAGPLRAVQLVDGHELWTTRVPGSHYLYVSSTDDGQWIHGCRLDLERGTTSLDRIDATNGECVVSRPIEGRGPAFFLDHGRKAWLPTEARVLKLSSPTIE